MASLTAIENRRRSALPESAASPLDPVHVALVKYQYLNLLPGPEACFRVTDAAAPGPRHRESEREPEGEREPERERERGKEKERERDSDRRRISSKSDRRRRSRSRSPPRVDPSEPIKKFPRELGHLLNQLSLAPDGPVPDMQQVIDVILRADFSLEGIEAHEAAAARERRRQRHASERGGAPGGPPPGAGVGPGMKRKAEPTAFVGESDSESSGSDGEDDGGGGVDVYRRRMRARI